MKNIITYILLALLAPTGVLADTVKLTNGREIHGKTEAHPVFFDTHIVVRFKNGGWMSLSNREVKKIIPNNKDQFEMRKGGVKG